MRFWLLGVSPVAFENSTGQESFDQLFSKQPCQPQTAVVGEAGKDRFRLPPRLLTKQSGEAIKARDELHEARE